MPRRISIAILSAALLALAVGLGIHASRHRERPDASGLKASSIKHHPSAPLRPLVATIIHDGPAMPYLKLNFLIKDLPTDLLPHEIDALIAFIESPEPSPATAPASPDSSHPSSINLHPFSPLQWGSLVNDIEEALTVQTTPSPAVAAALIRIARDPARSQIQRDYALQHIGGFAMFLVHTASQPAPSNAPGPSSSRHPSSFNLHPSSFTPHPLFPSLAAELTAAASDPTKPWCGTALNLLDGIHRAATYRQVALPGFDSDSLVALALPVARDPAAPLNARVPALQLAARHHAADALPLARDLLADPATPTTLTLAASAALAALGTPGDLPILEASLASRGPHTAAATRHAIQSIQSRNPR